MVVVPGATAVTTPVDPTTVAAEVFELLHVPPATASLNVILDVPATTDGPVTVPALAAGLTVSTCVAEAIQPFTSVTV